jgi:hypothetical protein
LERLNNFGRLASRNYSLYRFRLILVLAVIVIDSKDEEGSSQDSSYNQSYYNKSCQSDTLQPVTLQDAALYLRRIQHKSVIDKKEFRKQVYCDFK